MIAPEPYVHWCRLLHVSRAADARLLIANGMAWRGGPKTVATLIRFAIDHRDVVLSPRTPEPIRAVVAAGRSA